MAFCPAAPLRQWVLPSGVTSVLWSLTRPAVFAALTADSVLHYWYEQSADPPSATNAMSLLVSGRDLLSLEGAPLEVCPLAERDGETKKVAGGLSHPAFE